MNINLSGIIKNLKLQNINLESKLNELDNKNNSENESKTFKILHSPNNIKILNQNDSHDKKENINKLQKKIKDLEDKLPY